MTRFLNDITRAPTAIESGADSAAQAAANFILNNGVTEAAVKTILLHMVHAAWSTGGTALILPVPLLAQIVVALGTKYIPQAIQNALSDFLCLLLWHIAAGTVAMTGYAVTYAGETVYNGASCLMFRRQTTPDNPERFNGFDACEDEIRLIELKGGSNSFDAPPSPLSP